ncbi:hypothetical protein [Mycobacterium sp.]|uniref:hypothetical protein n=1 Tax=Mycobacterium sp. TaxID=1785 RepID=UPI002600AC12|nr:hypothetical protein [Mycobacterium sp.]MBW0014701.1 DUF2029 domain-containing protein [Mycobacterium sp.]
MQRPGERSRGAAARVRDRISSVANQSERALLINAVLFISAVSAVVAYVLAQYYSVDVLSSLVSNPEDCILNWVPHIGRHCFSDYNLPVSWGMRPNPWAPYPLFMPPDFRPNGSNYPAAAMVPQLAFALLAKWLSAPQLGLLGYLLALTIAVLTPAWWAARGARGTERMVIFVILGMVAIPAWMVLDRANSVAFLAPVGLFFLVGLCRRRWGVVAITVVLATLIKPQFIVLAVVLFAARQWRMGGVAIAGAVTSSLAAYLLWPRDFPATITQSLHNTLNYGSPGQAVGFRNVSFGRALMLIPDGIKAAQTGGKIPDGFLAGPRSVAGYAVLVAIVVAVLVLGPRIPPVLTGIMLLAGAPLFPSLVFHYYLVFVLPVAALVLRDPDGPPGAGIFDQLATRGGRRRAVGICVSLAVALSIAQIALPGPPFPEPVYGQVVGQPGVVGVVGTRPLVTTTLFLVPISWLIACVVIIVSYARRSATADRTEPGQTRECPPDNAVAASSCASEQESSRAGDG